MVILGGIWEKVNNVKVKVILVGIVLGKELFNVMFIGIGLLIWSLKLLIVNVLIIIVVVFCKVFIRFR